MLSKAERDAIRERAGLQAFMVTSDEAIQALNDLDTLWEALREACASEYWIRAPLTLEDVMPHHPNLARCMEVLEEGE